jgi:uncharacterized protein (DUF2384 family)
MSRNRLKSFKSTKGDLTMAHQLKSSSQRQEELDRLSPAAIRAFIRLVDLWELSEDEALYIIGEPGRSTYYRWKKMKTGHLSKDQLDRVSYLLGIFKSLEYLFPHHKESANQWIKKPNNAPFLGGQSALEFILANGIAGMFQVRRYLDAQRGAWS